MKVGPKHVTKIDLDETEYDRGYQDGWEEAIEEVYKKAEEKTKEQIEYLNKSTRRNGKMWAMYMKTYLGNIKTACEQLKEITK